MDPIENLGRKPIIFFQNYLSLLLPYIGKCEVKVKIDKFYHYSEYVASIQVKIQFFLRATIYYEYRRVYRIWIYLRQYLIKRILVRNVFQNEMVQSEIMFMFQVTVPVTLVVQTEFAAGFCFPNNPCEYGNCTDFGSQYNCSCDKGYESKNCSEDINECQTTKANFCKNGGQCVNTNGSFFL